MRKQKPPPIDLTESDLVNLNGSKPYEVSNSQSKGSKPKAHFDWKDWVHFWAGADCSEDELKELIETYWQIILAFLDLDIEVSDFEQALHVEKSEPILDLSTALRAAVVQSKNTPEVKETAELTTFKEEESREEIA